MFNCISGWLQAKGCQSQRKGEYKFACNAQALQRMILTLIPDTSCSTDTDLRAVAMPVVYTAPDVRPPMHGPSMLGPSSVGCQYAACAALPLALLFAGMQSLQVAEICNMASHARTVSKLQLPTARWPPSSSKFAWTSACAYCPDQAGPATPIVLRSVSTVGLGTSRVSPQFCPARIPKHT